MPSGVRALVPDVFGTCVDWRSGVIREVEAAARRKGVAVDAAALADAWRGRYQPAMERVRPGERPWTVLDVLHRESLDALLPDFGPAMLTEEERGDLTRAWHRLDPWPDVVADVVPRPTEHGPGQTTDLAPEAARDVVARDFLDLAARLGA